MSDATLFDRSSFVKKITHKSAQRLPSTRPVATFGQSYLARDVMELLRYAKWERFHGVIRRADQLIGTGAEIGKIVRMRRMVRIGSGGMRKIIDYRLDYEAMRLVERLSSSHKLNGYFHIRNETVILRLIEKFSESRGWSFEAQFRLSGFIFDGIVAGKVLIEFDEPDHEQSGPQKLIDQRKDCAAKCANLAIIRLGLQHDIIDAILNLEIAMDTTR